MHKKQKGFTLLEVLLVVAAIAILAGIVILAINPSKQLAETRNAQRRADVNTILNGVYQFALDNNGTIPTSTTAGTTCGGADTQDICITGGDCTGLTALFHLTDDEKYLVGMPTDPSAASGNNTGYEIFKSSNNRVTVCAPSAEESATISVTR